jgi:single-strand DNA-binding protein
MAGETLITVVGNLTADPELRFTPGGSAVSNFTVASTPRHFDKASNEWKDAETLFLRCAIWREAAEYVAESLKKGMRVIVQGRLKCRTYEDKAGEKRTVWECDVEEVGPSLRYASATVKRMTRQADPAGGYTNGGGNSGQPAAAGGAPVTEGGGDWGGGWGTPETEPVF